MGGWTIDVGVPLTVSDDEGDALDLRPKERAVVAALALTHPEAASIATISDLVWEHPPDTARKAVHNHVARLRQLADGIVESVAGGYRLGASVSIVRPSTDDVFRDLVDHPHVAVARSRFREARLHIEESEAADALPVRPDDEVVERLVRFAEDEPHRGVRWRLAAVALARSGRRRGALELLRRARLIRVLDPVDAASADRLEQAILDDDPRLDVNAELIGPIPGSDPDGRTPGMTGDRTDESFIDAGDVLAAIERHLVADDGGAIQLLGPAGAGKTTIAGRAAQVAAGRGWETHRIETRSHGAADTDVVTALHHSVAERVADRDDDHHATPLDRLVALLRSGDRRRFVIVDDVHHATEDESIALAELIVRTRDAGRILWLVSSRRAIDVNGIDVVEVPAWTADHVAQLLHRFVPPSDWTRGAAEWIVERADGNALGVRELAVDLVRRRDETTTATLEFRPPAERNQPVEWIVRRVERLEPDVTTALAGVAMVGHDFDLDGIATFSDDPASVIAAARLEGVITLGQGSERRFRFTHDLFREVLLDNIDDRARSELALLALRDPMFDDDSESRRRSMLARAAARDEPRRAIEETIAAAELEEERHHPVEAERLYRRALELIERHDDASDPTWLRAALRLGSVAISNGSHDATDILFDAVDRAIAAADTELASLILYELGRIGPASTVGQADTRLVDSVNRVRALDISAADKVRLDMAEMIVFGVGTDGGRARELLEDALATAHSTGDLELVAIAETAAYAATLRPADLPLRRKVIADIRRHGDELGNVELTYEGLRLEFCTAIEAGESDPRPLMERIEQLHARFNERSRNWSLFAFRSAIAWLDGDAERLQHGIDLILSPETVVSMELKLSTAGGHLLGLHLLRGDLADLDPFVAGLETDVPGLQAWNAARAATAAAAGDHETAAERLDRARSGAGFDLPDDFTTLPAVFLLGEAAATIGDERSLAVALDLLRRWSGLWIWHGTGTFGPIDLAIARWERARGGDPNEIADAARRALRSASIVGAPHVVADAASVLTRLPTGSPR